MRTKRTTPDQILAAALNQAGLRRTQQAYLGLDQADRDRLAAQTTGRPPGLGVPYLALIDAELLYVVLLMGLALVLPERLQGRLQGPLTLILSLLMLLLVVLLALAAIALLILMLSLLLSAPFGTLAYLALYGFFNRGGAGAALALILLFKLAFAGLLVAAQQRFLQNRSLILLLLTSLLAGVVVSFLHNFVPGLLVSITDALGAIVVAILALIWGVMLLLGGAVSTVSSIRLKV